MSTPDPVNLQPRELLQIAADFFESREISYRVVGSMASIAYGEIRFTNDVDIAGGPWLLATWDWERLSVAIAIGAERLSGFLQPIVTASNNQPQERPKAKMVPSARLCVLQRSVGMPPTWIDFFARSEALWHKPPASPRLQATWATREKKWKLHPHPPFRS